VRHQNWNLTKVLSTALLLLLLACWHGMFLFGMFLLGMMCAANEVDGVPTLLSKHQTTCRRLWCYVNSSWSMSGGVMWLAPAASWFTLLQGR